jgi:hypothetical protein
MGVRSLEKRELRCGLSYVIGISTQNALILYSQSLLSKHGLKMRGTMFDCKESPRGKQLPIHSKRQRKSRIHLQIIGIRTVISAPHAKGRTWKLLLTSRLLGMSCSVN